MTDWKWLIGYITTLAIVVVGAIYKLLEKVFSRLTKLEKDNEFTTKIIWEFLIAKVHNDDDKEKIDELLDKWKANKLKKAGEIERLVIGLSDIANKESDNSKRAAAELLLKMIDKGIGITEKM